jgi:hypothetical protein
VDLERYRKDAKKLVKAFHEREQGAVDRAESVLGARARTRFQLSDAQHVVAVEHGYRSWPELKRSVEAAEPERPVARIGLQPVIAYEERAAALAAAAARGEDEARRRVQAHVPRLRDYSGGVLTEPDARLVVACEYGFHSWRELVAEVERVRAEHEGQREGSPEVLAALDAIRRGDLGTLSSLLDEHPHLLHRAHSGAWTTLLEAIAQPDVVGEGLGAELGVDRRVVELLIDRGADLREPLGLAACFNRVELVQVLLDAGATTGPSRIWGVTPLETALYHGARESADVLAAHRIWPYALWTVAAAGRVDLLGSFFTDDGALRADAGAHRPNLSDVGWPPGAPPRDDPQEILDEALGHAAHNGRDEAVTWLLDHGADVDGRPYLDVTPLHFAVQFGQASTVRLLLERGADTSIRDRIHDATPLGWSEHVGRDDIAVLLDRNEEVIDTGLEYVPGDPVTVRVVRRRLVWVADDGRAVARADTPPGWREVAERLADELVVNVSRAGVVSLPVVPAGPGFEAIVRRVGEASLALYQEILELDD